MAYVSYGWDLNVFKQLCYNIDPDLSPYKISKEIGIGESSCRLMLEGQTVPYMSTILKIADYFAVPVDILLGRCSKDNYDKLLNDYANSFKLLRRYDYEEKLSEEMSSKAVGFIPKSFPDNKIEGAWPYNLLDILILGHWPYPISEDQDQGIVYALSLLTDKECDVIIRRFVSGETLETCAQELDLSKERIRQIECKAIKKLRHPVRFNSIIYGKSGNEERLGLSAEINDLIRERDLLKQKIIDLRQIVDEEADAIYKNPKSSHDSRMTALQIKYSTEVYEHYRPEIESMDLSFRSFNCLRRANCETVKEVIKLAESGTLMELRNFGRVSLIEVLTILKTKYDTDLFSLYDSYLRPADKVS